MVVYVVNIYSFGKKVMKEDFLVNVKKVFSLNFVNKIAATLSCLIPHAVFIFTFPRTCADIYTLRISSTYKYALENINFPSYRITVEFN